MAETREQLGRAIRVLMRSCRSATLSTRLAREGASGGDIDGWPYGSLVTVALDHLGAPLLLFSDLSDHTRNLKADARAALLFEQTSRRRNPQRGPRVTIMGRVRKTRRPADAQRFTAMHPESAMYSGFGDFNFYRMSVERAHWVGGFAKAQWRTGRHVVAPPSAAKALAEAEAGILDHMNADHADAIDLYAAKLLKRKGTGWRMIGIDPDGADLECGGRFARLAFPETVADAGQVRDVLVSLAAAARHGM